MAVDLLASIPAQLLCRLLETARQQLHFAVAAPLQIAAAAAVPTAAASTVVAPAPAATCTAQRPVAPAAAAVASFLASIDVPSASVVAWLPFLAGQLARPGHSRP